MKYFLIFLLFVNLSLALNILVYQTVIGKSHLNFSSRLINLLVQRGHTVDTVLARLNDLVEGNGTAKTRRTFEFRYSQPGHWFKNTPHLNSVFDYEPRTFVDIPYFHDVAYEFCEEAVADGGILNFISDSEYDIALINDYDMCGTLLVNAAKIPSIASFIPTPMFPTQYVSAGLPTVSSIYATTLSADHDGSFFDRAFHLVRSAYYLYVYRPADMTRYNKLARSHFGKNFEDVEKLNRNVDVAFINSNVIVEKPRPISHKIKYIGGIGMSKPKPLNENFERLLQLSPKGTVLFSFGTQVPTAKISLEMRKTFVKAFSKFPEYTFLWKYDKMDDDENLLENVTNVHRIEWLPQTDLLRDSRVKGFISHMGLNSFLETSAAGVPVVAIPLFIDQLHNSHNAESRGIGKIVRKHEITVERLVKALDEILNNPSYAKNAKMISKMMSEKPHQAQDVFIEWVEFAAANPRLHQVLNLPGADLDPFRYYSGDVVLVSVAVLFFTIFIFYKIISFALRSLKKVSIRGKKSKTQ